MVEITARREEEGVVGAPGAFWFLPAHRDSTLCLHSTFSKGGGDGTEPRLM